MIKLGNIIYSNTVPVHAGITSGVVKFPFKLVDGIPSELNAVSWTKARWMYLRRRPLSMPGTPTVT